jgi:hypothetical protein
VDVVAGEDPAGGELGVDRGDMDERVPVVECVELRLVGRLDCVVQFVHHPITNLFDQHLRVDVRCLWTK